MSVKEIKNVKVEKRRNNNLELLKKINGPFTNSSEVSAYMNDGSISVDAKMKRLYTEIRYARDTCLSLPKSSDIFRLKRNHKNLSVEEYATNLCIYLAKVTTNASVPDKLWSNFVDKVSFISEYKKLKRFRVFVSVDGWGDQAEYMRHGLDFDRMWNNVHNYLTRVDEGLVTFIVTFNMLSLPSIKKLLEGILELQRVHNITKSRRDENGKIVVYGHHKVFLDTPMLRYPHWQSLQLTPESHWHYADEALEFMKQNQDKHRASRWVGFKPHQIERFDRSIEFMKQGFDDPAQRAEAEENFVRFFSAHDHRRNTDFSGTFPEFAELFAEWKDKYNV